jgi:hypothetical protein
MNGEIATVPIDFGMSSVKRYREQGLKNYSSYAELLFIIDNAIMNG